MTETPEQRLEAMGLTLPDAPPAVANYVPALAHGPLLYISGQLPKTPDGTFYTGRLGADSSIETGQLAAQACALNILAQAKAVLGDLSRIEATLRLSGFVCATAEFTDHAQVVNGASNLMAHVLGGPGKHTRIAVGVASLPLGAAVEVDATFAIATS